jgi:hypothetical protein
MGLHQMSHRTMNREQSSNFLLASASMIILGFGPLSDPWLYFCSFQGHIRAFEWGLLFDERTGLAVTVDCRRLCHCNRPSCRTKYELNVMLQVTTPLFFLILWHSPLFYEYDDCIIDIWRVITSYTFCNFPVDGSISVCLLCLVQE